MFKKIAPPKKNCPGPPPMNNFFSFGVPKGKKLPLGAPNGKKLPLGTKGNKNFLSFKPLEDFFFSCSPKGSFFPFGTPKEKKNCSCWGGHVFLFFYFFGNFYQRVKKLLNFWNFVNIKVAKFKLNHLG